MTTYREPTNPLLIKLKALKVKDLVDFKIISIMYRAKQSAVAERYPKAVSNEGK